MKHKLVSLVCICAAVAVSIPLTVFASTVREPDSANETDGEFSIRYRNSRTGRAAADESTDDTTDDATVDPRAHSQELRLAYRAQMEAAGDTQEENKTGPTKHKLTGEDSIESRIQAETDEANSSAAVHVYTNQSSDDFVYQTMVFTSYYDEIVSAYVDFDMLYRGEVDFSPTAKFTCYSQLIITYDGGKTATLTNRSSTQYTANDCQTKTAYYGHTYNLADYEGITRIVWTMRLDLVSSSTGQYYTWYESQTKSQIISQGA